MLENTGKDGKCSSHLLHVRIVRKKIMDSKENLPRICEKLADFSSPGIADSMA